MAVFRYTRVVRSCFEGYWYYLLREHLSFTKELLHTVQKKKWKHYWKHATDGILRDSLFGYLRSIKIQILIKAFGWNSARLCVNWTQENHLAWINDLVPLPSPYSWYSTMIELIAIEQKLCNDPNERVFWSAFFLLTSSSGSIDVTANQQALIFWI
jgi:hypothetical protein